MIKISDMIGISNARLIFGSENDLVDFNNFSKDSRIVKDGDVFIGIKGDNFDGNDYFEEAYRKGAKTCILSKKIDIAENLKDKYKDKNLIIVDNIEEFLVGLAKPIREKLNIPIIAITGSVGKTSTKNIISDVLSNKYKVLKTSGNLNTLIGLALTILRVSDEEIAVIELGMSQAGEISKLTNFLKPNIGVIINIGTAHIGNLGSRENILKAKLELLEGLQDVLFINNDNDLLNKWYSNKENKIPTFTYGIDNESEFQGRDLKYDKNGSHFSIENNQIDINVIGKHFIYNSIIAYAIGKHFEVKAEDIIEKLKSIPLEPDRMELINNNDIAIINDTYNASYDSVYYALEVLSTFRGRKIAVLGDIKELGDFSEKIHRSIGNLIIKNNIDILITIGDFAKYINEEAIVLGFKKENNYHFNDKSGAIELINSIKKSGDNYLIKASNSMKFKEIVEKIK